MKKLLLVALLVFTSTATLAEGEGERDTTCARMVDAQRNETREEAVVPGAEVTEEVAPEADAT